MSSPTLISSRGQRRRKKHWRQLLLSELEPNPDTWSRCDLSFPPEILRTPLDLSGFQVAVFQPEICAQLSGWLPSPPVEGQLDLCNKA